MPFGIGLGAGLKALNAARLGIQTAGQNVANVNTPGYSRQRMLQSSSMPFALTRGLMIGTGVHVDDVSRIFDQGLQTRIGLQSSMFGSATTTFDRLREIEGLFIEPDGGLSKDLSELFGSLGRLQTDPSDGGLRGGVVQAGRALSQNLQMLGRRLTDLGSSTYTEVNALVRIVNEKTSSVADLNVQIVAMEANGASANDLRDRRDQLVLEIAELVDTRTVERGTGSVDLLVGGRVLVSGGRSTDLSVTRPSLAETQVGIDHGGPVAISGGKIGALLAQEGTSIPGITSDLDALARTLALEFNRLHSTGVPGKGPFQSIVSHYGTEDTNGNGVRGDELLSSAGLPFEIQHGELYVKVTNRTTGEVERTRLTVDPSNTTLQEFAAQLDGVDNLSASVDPVGRLRIFAPNGYGFDFGAGLDATPDAFGSFGGQSPVLGSAGAGPFDLSGAAFPQTFTVDVDGTLETVTLQAADFKYPAAATTDELVAAMQDDLTVATVKNIGGRVVIRGDTAGNSSSMSLADGAGGPLANLGMALGPAAGQANGVDVAIGGTYSGSDNGRYVFVPDGNGEIGVTPGLTVSVYDENGLKVTTLNVGAGYDGDELPVTDGITVTFGHGTVSATDNQVFALDALADSDTTDILPALGINSFFIGDSAETLRVNPDLERDSSLLAAGLSDASGDASNLLRMLGLRDSEVGALGNTTVEGFFADLVGEIGFDVATAEHTLENQESMMAYLEEQRQAISGVNLDEEMVDLVAYQQAYEAAARFINVVQDLTDTLLSLGR